MSELPTLTDEIEKVLGNLSEAELIEWLEEAVSMYGIKDKLLEKWNDEAIEARQRYMEDNY